MPYSYLDVKLPNPQSEEKLQAALYQITVGLSSLIDEIQGESSKFNRPGFFIDNLNLTRTDHRALTRYFSNHHNDSLTANQIWLNNWLNNNIYEMPADFVLRMTHAYRKWFMVNYEEVELMPNHWQEIQLPDPKSQVALQAVLFQINSVMVDIVDRLKSTDPNFELPFQLTIGLTQDESATILQHFLFHRGTSLDESTQWLAKWLNQNGYSVPTNEITRAASNIQRSIRLMD
ncbi:hypothetical protein [Lentilactobacillus kisonensis]|uniref:Uncharacterized protein n=1 Tax=Lentilactobacillus kisonensis DSM 19906 = JCM 15041 TaxID=1423766 RepID=A0A0R1NK88_9LACO|nr:hypothetical protein [Lentilactobacillus kisonensis]KRL20813.1 hypothetical protein FC98_GL001218 [Lentilactobacillus kisonensis DSM 19906 = JCM 15041]